MKDNLDISEKGWFTDLWSKVCKVIEKTIDIVKSIPNNLYLINHDILDLFTKLNEKYGGGEKMNPVPFVYRFGSKCVLVTKPEHIVQVFTGKEFDRSAPKNFLDKFRELLGFSLITVDPHYHKEVRMRTLDFLTGRSLQNFGNIMINVIDQIYLPKWKESAKNGNVIDITKDMFYYSSEVSFCGILDIPINIVPNEVHQALNRVFSHVRSNLLRIIPLPNIYYKIMGDKFKEDKELIQRFIRPYIDKNRELDNPIGWTIRYHTKRQSLNLNRLGEYVNDDYLVEKVVEMYNQNADIFDISKKIARELHNNIGTSMEQLQVDIAAILCDGGIIDEKNVLDELTSNLIGGSETTILMMAWGLYRLSLYPNIQEELYDNIMKINTTDKILKQEEVWNCKYLQNTLSEILRLDSPAYIFPRSTIEDVHIGNLHVPKGTVIWGSQYITQRSLYVWDNPLEFNPKRWDSKPKDGTFFTFTIGSRMCPGNRYAYLEAGLAISTLVRYFKISLDPTCPTNIGHDLGVTYRPNKPIKILLQLR